MKQKNKKEDFLECRTGKEDPKSSKITGRGVMGAGEGTSRAGEGKIRTAEGTIRAGECTIRAGQDTHPLTDFDIKRISKMNLHLMMFIQK